MMNWLKMLKPLILVNLLRKTDYDNNVSDTEGKIPNTTGLATTTTARAPVKSTIPS